MLCSRNHFWTAAFPLHAKHDNPANTPQLKPTFHAPQTGKVQYVYFLVSGLAKELDSQDFPDDA